MELSPLKRLALAFKALAGLDFWPGELVRVYGVRATYLRLVASGYHVVDVEGRQQLAPPESVH